LIGGPARSGSTPTTTASRTLTGALRGPRELSLSPARCCGAGFALPYAAVSYRSRMFPSPWSEGIVSRFYGRVLPRKDRAVVNRAPLNPEAGIHGYLAKIAKDHEYRIANRPN
jgi:hypothetical protein